MNPLLSGMFFSCDMIEFNINNIKTDTFFTDYGIELNWNIDQDNSPNAFIDLLGVIFTYRKSFFKGGFTGLVFSTSVDNISIDCFAFLQGSDVFGGKQKSKDRVVFYSSFFVLEKMQKFDFSISEFYQFLFPAYLKLYRIDICLDLPCTIKELQETIFSKTRFFSQIGEDKKHPEFSQTYYIKNPQSSQNRSYIIRIYDKVLDTFKKQKGFLYPHLKNSPDVRRIELELRPKECITYPYKIIDYLENKDNLLQKLFTKYLNKNISDEYHIDYGLLFKDKHYNQKFNLKQEFLNYGHIPENYLSRAYGYLHTIRVNTGYKGLFQLLTKGLKEDLELFYKNKRNSNKEGKYKSHDSFILMYETLDEFINYILTEGASERKVNQILKKYLTLKSK